MPYNDNLHPEKQEATPLSSGNIPQGQRARQGFLQIRSARAGRSSRLGSQYNVRLVDHGAPDRGRSRRRALNSQHPAQPRLRLNERNVGSCRHHRRKNHRNGQRGKGEGIFKDDTAYLHSSRTSHLRRSFPDKSTLYLALRSLGGGEDRSLAANKRGCHNLRRHLLSVRLSDRTRQERRRYQLRFQARPHLRFSRQPAPRTRGNEARARPLARFRRAEARPAH